MKLKFIFCFVMLAIVLTNCSKPTDEFVSYDNANLEIMGRTEKSDSTESLCLYWSGTQINFNFEGTTVAAILEDERGDNYFNIIIDDSSSHVLKLDAGKNEYQLCKLPNGNHNIKIFKRTEWDRGIVQFYGIKLLNNTKLINKPLALKRKIEFYGNSITCGYAVDDLELKDRPDSIFTNNYLAYSAITARHYNAQYFCTAKSGIGITISWFPQVMPEIYDRINPFNPNSIWDFNKYQPDIVVVNLLQNDSWLVERPEHESFKLMFGTKKPSDSFEVNAYKKFILNLRSKYPYAKIICMLGSMDITKKGSRWPGIVKTAVNKIKDNDIYTLFVPYKGTPGHPSRKEQQDLADSLIAFIDNNIQW